MDNRKPVGNVTHVEVGDEHVKILRGDEVQRFGDRVRGHCLVAASGQDFGKKLGD